MDTTASTAMQMRGEGLGTAPGDDPTFAGRIELPYKLTPGRAAASFLAELGRQRILGSRCPSCANVMVPAQDFCAPCGEAAEDLLALAPTGSLSGFTETANGVLGLIRLDGASTDFVHRILDAELGDLKLGQRLTARWAPEPQGTMLDLAGFALEDSEPSAEQPAAVGDVADPIVEQPYQLRLDYEHAYGPYYGRLFDEIATSRRIEGVRCPRCERVLVPPREYCDTCFVRTAEWVDVADTGVIKAFSIIHLEFVGQVREPPYVYAEIVLDGAATRLIHTIGGIEVDEAMERLRPGMAVRAVWNDNDEPKGTLEDILYFEPIFKD
jgi:uncharacterized OB-fold protein